MTAAKVIFYHKATAKGRAADGSRVLRGCHDCFNPLTLTRSGLWYLNSQSPWDSYELYNCIQVLHSVLSHIAGVSFQEVTGVFSPCFPCFSRTGPGTQSAAAAEIAALLEVLQVIFYKKNSLPHNGSSVTILIIIRVCCVRACVCKIEKWKMDRKLPVESSVVKCFVISPGKLVQQLQSDHHFYMCSPFILISSSSILMLSLTKYYLFSSFC